MSTIPQGPWTTTPTEIDDVIKWVQENPPNGVVKQSDYTPEYPLNDKGNAARFAAAFSGRYRFNHDTKLWYRWNGVIWALDNKAQVQEDAKTIAASIDRDGRQIAFDALAAMDRNHPDHWKQEWRKSMLAWAKQSGMEFHIAKMLKLASSIPPIGVVTEELDADKVLIAFPNGYLNLKTREFTDPIKDKLVTKCTGAPRIVNAKCELWDATFKRFVPDEAERIDLITAFGYGWSGRGKEHMFLPYGETKCGKSTIIGAVVAALKDYATTVGMETFASSKYTQAGGTREDLVALVGKRMVAASEATEHQRINPALLKRLLGGTDKISMRGIYGRQFETLPTFALWLLSNYAPKLPADDDAMMGRVHVFPFTHQIPPEERDETERDKVVNPTITGSAILWQIEEGWFRFIGEQHGKLSLPTTVEATNEYKNELDVIRKFIDERAVVGPDEWCVFGEFKTRFREWLQSENIPDDYSDTRIGRWLEKHGYAAYQDTKTLKRCRRGLSFGTAMWM